jgi:hypothetical protein
LSVSAKRRGVSLDPATESRFRRIEAELDARALANYQVGPSAMRRGKSTVSQVSGLGLDTQIIGGIGVKWSAADIPDIKKYQVQYADNNGFVGATTIESYSTHFTLPDASPETPYYIRVRAIDSKGEDGAWSSTLNSETGQATVSNLADGAASSIIVKTKTDGFDPAQLIWDGDLIGQYLSTSIDFPVPAETLIIGIARGDFLMRDADSFFIRIKIDGTSKIEYENTMNTGFGTTTGGTITVPGLTVPVLIDAGRHQFLIEIEIQDNSAANIIYYTPDEVSLAIWEVRK